MYETYKDRAAFLFVYIQEAHPSDGWQTDANVQEDVVLPQPQKWVERQGGARPCCERLDISMPTVVDTMDNKVDNLYAGWPERIFIVDRDGKIAYAGNQGPWG